MDTERIERALREGPMDEPLYVPGAFRRTRPSARWFAAAAAAAAAVVIGIVIGLGFDVLRGDRAGSVPPAVQAADLEGRWISDEIPLDLWVDELTARGFDPNDLGNFLAHDPFDETVRYVLVFDGARLSFEGIFDRSSPIGLSRGEFAIRADGTFEFVEVTDQPPPVGDACQVVAGVTLENGRLQFDVQDLPGCGVEPAIAHTAFFDLATYARREP